MPEPLSATPAGTILRGAAIGFCGKLPARGDFVTTGLPRRFAEAWHDWLQPVLAASRRALGEDWLAAWLEAPVWRFALWPGTCGPDSVLGLWMPSVDSVGRHFPLTFAAIASNAHPALLIREGGGFLAAVEGLGLEALADDLAPDALTAQLAAAASADPSDAGIDPEQCPPAGALWWSAGSPRVPRTAFATGSLPDEAAFVGMLDAGAVVSEADFREP